MVGMRKSRLSPAKQSRLQEHFVAGTTARCAAALVGVNPKTAVYYFHRLRETIAYQLEQEVDAVFSGVLEIDESYFGDTRKGKRGRGAAGKTPVFGLLKRGERFTRKLFQMRRRRHYTRLSSARSCQTASFIPTVGRATMYWMYRPSSTVASIIQSYSLISRTTLTASRTSGIRPSVICGSSTVFPRSILGYF